MRLVEDRVVPDETVEALAEELRNTSASETDAAHSAALLEAVRLASGMRRRTLLKLIGLGAVGLVVPARLAASFDQTGGSAGGWVPPIGIPDPGWGINAAAPSEPSNWAAGPLPGWYWVEPTNVNATDSGNPNGYPGRPRQTVPLALSAGNYVRIKGNYDQSHDGGNVITANGTATQPVWIRAASQSGDQGGTLRAYWTIKGSYCFIENLNGASPNPGIGQSFGLTVAAPADHIMMRNGDLAGDYSPNTSGAGGLGTDNLGSSLPIHNIIFYNLKVHDLGSWAHDTSHPATYFRTVLPRRFQNPISTTGNTLTSTNHGITAADVDLQGGCWVKVTSGPQNGEIHQVRAVVNASTLTLWNPFSVNQLNQTAAAYQPVGAGDKLHGFQAGTSGTANEQHHFWIVDCEFSRCSGDGWQTTANENLSIMPKFHHFYFGRNKSYDNKQTGGWSKSMTDVVMSQNEIYNIWGSPSSPNGLALGHQYGPERVWYLFNRIHDCLGGIGIMSNSGGGTGLNAYCIGNVLYDLGFPGGATPLVPGTKTGLDFYGPYDGATNSMATAAICNWSQENLYVVNNTIENVPGGIYIGSNSITLYAINNIVGTINQPGSWQYFYDTSGGSEGASRVQNNCFTATFGARIGNTTYNSLSAFQNGSTRVDNKVVGDQLYSSAASKDLRPKSGAPTIDAGQAYTAPFASYKTLYGQDIQVDFNGVKRPQGSGWDVGAYEFTGSAAKPPAPTNLRIVG